MSEQSSDADTHGGEAAEHEGASSTPSPADLAKEREAEMERSGEENAS